MEPMRHEVREFIRVSESLLSLESFDAPLTEQEHGVILLCIQDLTKQFAQTGTRPNGHARGNEHGKTLADS